MQPTDPVAQRPLFVEWPRWQQLPEEVRQRVERLLATVCVEIVQSNNDQEQSHE